MLWPLNALLYASVDEALFQADWLKNRALREIQDAECRVPGFGDVNAALTAIGKDLSPGPELLP